MIRENVICVKCPHSYCNSTNTEGNCVLHKDLLSIDENLKNNNRPNWCPLFPKKEIKLSEYQIKLEE